MLLAIGGATVRAGGRKLRFTRPTGWNGFVKKTIERPRNLQNVKIYGASLRFERAVGLFGYGINIARRAIFVVWLHFCLFSYLIEL